MGWDVPCLGQPGVRAGTRPRAPGLPGTCTGLKHWEEGHPFPAAKEPCRDSSSASWVCPRALETLSELRYPVLRGYG